MTINVLDKEVVDKYKKDMKQGVDGIILKILDANNKGLYGGIVWPNEQYEYDAEIGGEYKICIEFTESMFTQTDYKQIKTEVKFNSDFHRANNAEKKNRQQFHKMEKERKAQEEKDMNALTHGHFQPIRRRVNRIYKKILEIKQFQNYKREQEEMYEANQSKLSSNFMWLSVFQIVVVAISSAFSVWNLKKFCVKKAIF